MQGAIDPTFLDNLITGDKTWIFKFCPETKQQSLEWHTTASQRPKKAFFKIIAFFEAKGVLQYEILPEGQTMKGTFYLEVLRWLKRNVNQIRATTARNWKLHNDNAPRHICSIVTDCERNCDDIRTPLQLRHGTIRLFPISKSEIILKWWYSKWRQRNLVCVPL